MRKFTVEKEEALPLAIQFDADMTGATVTARLTLNGATVTTFTGRLDAPIGGAVRSGTLDIPGSFFSAKGTAAGVLVITGANGEAWSPAKERFDVFVQEIP